MFDIKGHDFPYPRRSYTITLQFSTWPSFWRKSLQSAIQPKESCKNTSVDFFGSPSNFIQQMESINGNPKEAVYSFLCLSFIFQSRQKWVYARPNRIKVFHENYVPRVGDNGQLTIGNHLICRYDGSQWGIPIKFPGHDQNRALDAVEQFFACCHGIVKILHIAPECFQPLGLWH